LALLLVLLMVPGLVLAEREGSGAQGDDTGSTLPSNNNATGNQNQASNQGDSQQLREQEREEIGDGNGTQAMNRTEKMEMLRERMENRKQEMEENIEALGEGRQQVYRNQNEVREAVHNLLDMREMLDEKGIGQNVSGIAREFNNSLKVTLEAEERIQNRSRFIRFLVGGDDEAADQIEQQITTNRERIQQLNQLKEQLKDDEELRQMFQDQIQQMEQEQTRLQNLAQNETRSRGLFGWLFRK
jgi:hypothetical protein